MCFMLPFLFICMLWQFCKKSFRVGILFVYLHFRHILNKYEYHQYNSIFMYVPICQNLNFLGTHWICQWPIQITTCRSQGLTILKSYQHNWSPGWLTSCQKSACLIKATVYGGNASCLVIPYQYSEKKLPEAGLASVTKDGKMSGNSKPLPVPTGDSGSCHWSNSHI